MLHGTGILLILLIYIGIIATVLTLLWRIVVALNLIAQRLLEIAQDMKKLASRSDQPK
jgi:hypothetical protein